MRLSDSGTFSRKQGVASVGMAQMEWLEAEIQLYSQAALTSDDDALYNNSDLTILLHLMLTYSFQL